MTQRSTPLALLALSGVAVLGLAACGPRTEQAPIDAAPTEPPVSATTSGSSTMGGQGGWSGPMTLTAMQVRSDERFNEADADGDGVVTTAELEAPADDRGGPGRGGGRGLARADTDDDGRITREEARAQVAERFTRMDVNGDGAISEDERPQRGGRGGYGDRSEGAPAGQSTE